MNELRSDPKRQANYTIDAYVHQIWHSLLRWIDLKEALFLEGAEDIDLYRSDEVRAIQVKKTLKPLTLGSTDALESIANFWRHKRQNPGVTIKFQFLTTAERGRERSKPFGEVKGLDLWDSCKHQGSNPKALRDFLSRQQRLPKELRDLIKTATDEQLRLEWLIPIEWNTGGNPQPFVEDAVERKVSGYGDRVFNLQHSESVKAIPRLFQHVIDTARQKGGRWLYPADFRRLFEDAITERVPTQELRRLRLAATSFAWSGIQSAMIGMTGESKVMLSTESILEVLRPPHNERLVRRIPLVADLLNRLNERGLLALRGSTGMGKSTLATAVAMSGAGNWRRLDMRGVEPEQVKDRLLYAAYLIEDSREQIDCIVDDLNFDSQPYVYENALSRLIYAVKPNNGRFIITTQGMLPSRTAALYGISPDSFFDVPLLSEQEVTELVSNHGCPAGSILDKWGQTIFLSTKGHPQLAHARVINQEVKGWYVPTLGDLVSSPGIDEIRREIRQRLREQLSSDDARTLLYRLSVFIGRFERQQALHLGRFEPQVRMPGDVFDSLVGPWVEQVDERRFRLSPLLENIAIENFLQQELVELHSAAARSFLALPSIDLLGFSSLLAHAFAGQDRESLVAAALSVFSKEDGVSWSALSTVIGWFGFIKLEQGEKLVDEDLFLSVLLRRLQFKIAVEIKPDLAVKVARVWEQEVRHLFDEQLPAEISRMELLVFLNEVTSAERVPFPILTALSYLCENFRVLKNIKEYLPDATDERDSLGETDYRLLANTRFFLFLAKRRCNGATDVVEMLAAMDELSGEEIEEFWQLLSNNDNEATLLIDNGWLAESAAETPDWQTYLEILERALAIASQRKAISLIAAIYRAKAIVLKEYCDDRQGAMEALAEGERAIGHQHIILKEYRAKIFFLEKNHEEALAIWRSVFLDLENDEDEGWLYAYRDAAICAAELGYWAEAADLSRRGAEAAKLPLVEVPDRIKYQQDHTIEYSFRAERAFALWKAGECAVAVNEFANIAETFAKPPGVEGDIHSHLLYRRIWHAISWMELQLNGSQSLFEPKSGWFTQRDPEDKIIKELPKTPPPPLTQVWYILARLEYKLMPGDSMFKRLESELLTAPLPIVMLGYYDLRLRQSLRQLRAEGLIDDFLNLSAELKSRAEQQEKKLVSSDAAELKQILFAALIKFLSEGHRQTVPISQWKRDVDKSAQLKEEVGEWLDYVKKHLDDDPHNLIAILTDHTADDDRRWLAALLLATVDDLDPETLFCAHVLLVQSNYGSQWQDVYADSLASMISREWEKIAEQQSHTLLSPRLNCPAILSTCRDASRNGMRRVAATLLSVKNAVQTKVPETILDKLRRLAEIE